MLVLSRKTDESVVVDDEIVITVVEIRGNRVKLGIVAPADIPIMREELTRQDRVPVETGP